LGDWPISGERIDTHVHSDVDENIYEIERDFPDSHSPVRKVNQLVVELGETEGVKTYIVPAPLICTLDGPHSDHLLTRLVLNSPHPFRFAVIYALY
jgi:hypothetical protein